MCNAIRIARPETLAMRKTLSLAIRKALRLIWKHRKMPEKPLWKSCDVGLRWEISACISRSSDAKCLQFGLSLRFGLRCERPRCQIPSDAGRAMPWHWGGKSVVTFSRLSMCFLLTPPLLVHEGGGRGLDVGYALVPWRWLGGLEAHHALRGVSFSGHSRLPCHAMPRPAFPRRAGHWFGCSWRWHHHSAHKGLLCWLTSRACSAGPPVGSRLGGNTPGSHNVTYLQNF